MFTFLCKGLWWDTAEKGLSCCFLLQQMEGGGWCQWCQSTNIWWSSAPAMGLGSSASLQPPLADSLSTPLLKWELVSQQLPACTCVQRPPNCIGSQIPLQPRGPPPLRHAHTPGVASPVLHLRSGGLYPAHPGACGPTSGWTNQQTFLPSFGLKYTFSNGVWSPALARGSPSQVCSSLSTLPPP